MKKLSIDIDSTLENWIMLSKVAFGEDSKATLFLVNKVKESPKGLKQEIVCEERILINYLWNIYAKEIEGGSYKCNE